MFKRIGDNLININSYLFFAIILTGGLLISLGIRIYNTTQDVIENSIHSEQISKYTSDIRYYDEVLSNTALLTATDSINHWEERYNQNKPKLDTAISKLLEIDSLHAINTIRSTDTANQKLLVLEQNVFNLVHNHRHKEAFQILNGDEYKKLKAIYASKLNAFINLHESERKNQQNQLENEVYSNIIISAILILLLIVIWLFIGNLINKNRQLIINNNNELIKINEEKDKFFSIVTHDLKNPFNAILGFSQILADKVKENDFKSVEKYAGIIQKSSQNAMDLLSNLIDWSRSQTGRLKFNPIPFKIEELINNTLLVLTDVAFQKSITIQKSIISKTTVYADTDMISTVLRNLISNAIKFTNAGGKVIISTKETTEELIVSVKDNGLGISNEKIDKLFDLNENNSTLGTQKEKGTGLGLILCKEFIEINKGKIWIESDEGKGSIFYFTIPYHNL